MHLQNEAAGPIAVGTGGEVDVKAVAAHLYQIRTLNANDLAAAMLVACFGLSEAMARVICELSGFGGRHA